ncbi:uncharacterized protein CANTADRAFT_41270, partial [Suhomyces tanzawaensis NRRL Y-17324]
VASGKEISGVFTSLDSIVFKCQNNALNPIPATPSWIATLVWGMDSTLVSPDDTFTLTMPCVFSIPLGSNTLDLQAEGKTYATCLVTAGGVSLPYSTIQCTVTNDILLGDVVEGTVFFPVTFNGGGSSSPADLECAVKITSGRNNIAFLDGSSLLSTVVDFNEGSENGKDLLLLNNYIKSLPASNNLQALVMGSGNCQGQTSVSLVAMTVSVGGINAAIDCDSLEPHVTNGINDWSFPESSEPGDFDFYTECSPGRVLFLVNDLAPGLRPYMNFAFSDPTSDAIQVQVSVSNACDDGTEYTDAYLTIYNRLVNEEAGSSGRIIPRPITTVTTPCTGTITITSTAFGNDGTNTEIIEVPITTTTITTAWSGSFTTSTTAIGEGTNTVIIEILIPTVTITTGWTGSDTTTTTATGDDGTNTLIIETPVPTVTITTPWTGADTTSVTITGTDGTNTLAIETP